MTEVKDVRAAAIRATIDRIPTRHLHLYGLAPERLDERRACDMESGQVIPYNRNFMTPTATAAG